ncbi:MAG: hypothetical protein A2270_05775 [Elusimicrobia bacterium RIFOXYA12_FULL_51_18]|nr:MAG: hypothetical protein A2270_05775 [Elusimicrobia bacterium RIFOXYA12_FULL_51_18]OGS31566.1 MAG: hypothetical protein A2218_03545 [Elusimicrobia bacterium RIFOXYA2_FULL_53_38]
MKKAICIISSICFLCLAVPVFSGEPDDSDSALAVDFPSGWKTRKSDDPAVVLKSEQGRSFFEFVTLDSELSDYYLQARVKEQVDSLRSKGNSLSGDIRSAGIHGVSTAYYTVYEAMGDPVYTAFFTYSGVSYAISARGLDDGDFRGVISTIRKPGEKIELPRPRKIKVVRKSKLRLAESRVQIFKEDEEPEVPTASAAVSALVVEASTTAATAGPEAAGPVEVDSPALRTGQGNAAPSAGANTLRAARDLFSKLELNKDAARTPYIRRKPLDLYIWAALLAFWVLGSLWARARAEKFQNPKLSPPPKDVPPDFFFPFIISRSSTLKNCTYNVITRQKQLLLVYFEFGHEFYVAGSIYGGILFHFFWSLLAFSGKGEVAANFLLMLPGGRLWASAPEIFFMVPLIAGISMYFNKKQVLELYDSQSNLLMEAKKEVFYCLIRDGKGKELARIMNKGGLAGRSWDFVDTDNQIVFTVKDDYPAVHIMRKFFGNLGGALRSRYGIFAAERRAGFVFWDPLSADRFQIHLDFDFARLAHPAQMLACILYIISKEKDPVYPWPF